VVSVNGIFSVTVTVPSMMISSEPVGRISLLQLFRSDHAPVGPPTQTPFAKLSGAVPQSALLVDTELLDRLVCPDPSAAFITQISVEPLRLLKMIFVPSGE